MISAYSSAWAALGPTLVNHWWQSTMFAAVVGILALSLRKNSPDRRSIFRALEEKGTAKITLGWSTGIEHSGQTRKLQ